MADASQLQLNPYALFDPSQWANPYSQFQNTALPGASYVGMPTNYAGQPIQPQPGMTINQTPAQPTGVPGASNPGQWAFNNSLLNAMGRQPGAASNLGAGNVVNLRAQNNALYGMQQPFGGPVLQSSGPNAAQPAAAQPTPAANPGGGLTPQQYMALRANPGPVPTYGATVPAAASSAQPTSSGPGGQGVLQQFLANWKPAQSGAGSGFQQGFSTALKGMGY